MADNLKSSLFPAGTDAEQPVAPDDKPGDLDNLKMRDSVRKAIEAHHPAMLDSIMNALAPKK